MPKTYSVKGKVPYEVAQAIGQELASQLPETQIVGSLRRGCAVVGDVDLLTTSTVAMEMFARLVDEVFVRGTAKISGRKGTVQIDLNFTTIEAMGSALLHHTGSARFNVFTRSRAKRQGYSLSQHGLFNGDQLIASATEEEILGLLDMTWYLDPARRSR
jgi:DNA polymerase (family 10)